jgi:hypothetical protein
VIGKKQKIEKFYEERAEPLFESIELKVYIWSLFKTTMAVGIFITFGDSFKSESEVYLIAFLRTFYLTLTECDQFLY